MTRAFATNRAPESEWKTVQYRLTVFFRPNISLKGEGLWERVTGLSPESSTAILKTSERIELGAIDNMQLVLNANPTIGRIDWQFTNSSLAPDAAENVTSAGQAFVDLMTVYFKSDDLPPLSRIALGGMFILPVDTIELSYSRLCDYLTFDVDRVNSSDFMYQINRRRKSTTINGLEINRLMKWSATKFLQHEMTAAGIASAPVFPKFACNLELDINTAPLPDYTIQTAKLPDLLNELFSLAKEIVREGDIQ